LKAYKAVFFKNGSHNITELECKELTDDAIVISRTPEEMTAAHSSAPIIQQRETSSTRFCSSINEAVDFIESKYQDKIEEISGLMFDLKQKKCGLMRLRDEKR